MTNNRTSFFFIAVLLLAFAAFNNQYVSYAFVHPQVSCVSKQQQQLSLSSSRSVRSILFASSSDGEESKKRRNKDTDRARLERNFEQAMDNDWRVFRANLIAQEQAEAKEIAKKRGLKEKEGRENENDESITNIGGTGVDNTYGDEKLSKQSHLSDLFTGAITNLFSKNKDKKKNNSNKEDGADNDDDDTDNDTDIFNGDSIGGLLLNSDTAADEIILNDPEINLLSQDPFLTEDELSLLLKPKAKPIDKHRWAHSISHIEPGCTLLANEKLGGVFHQTVILIIDHNEATGSTGIVINRPLEGDLNKIASETDSNVDLSLKLAFNSARVTYGGPVMAEEYSVLHGFGEVDGSKKLCPGVFVGGSEELMNEVHTNTFSAKEALFVKGHAAWVPGQLSKEVHKGVWYVASVSSDLILRYAGAPISEEDNKDDLWSDIMTSMGGDYADIAKAHATEDGDMRGMKP